MSEDNGELMIEIGVVWASSVVAQGQQLLLRAAMISAQHDIVCFLQRHALNRADGVYLFADGLDTCYGPTMRVHTKKICSFNDYMYSMYKLQCPKK